MAKKGGAKKDQKTKGDEERKTAEVDGTEVC